ncbi:hypothetical protein CHH28_07090 [Bacterioplanes sanyensis]|uniref:Uncharacterized protein n=1 Tax=Bacterioplanes sanyensis TaxID=1249553 RepID=A0A222FJ54_9GAMM|nr:hypothetical protein [Bacterioplanes sanyensis]ASP38451.1 hypothetical protein CHH28_07090 [Bacterioplanes sanyensis]
MIKVKLVEHKGKKSLGLHENDWSTFSKCCDVIEKVFDGSIENKERLPTPAALADIYITYHLESGAIDINLDEAWGIDIFCSSDDLLTRIQEGMDSSHDFTVCT